MTTKRIAILYAIGVLWISAVANAATGLERYFPFSAPYKDPKITVRASDSTAVELLSQSPNPHITGLPGREAVMRAYFLTTLTTARDIVGIAVDFADTRVNTQIRSIGLAYETIDGTRFDCYNPLLFAGPLVTLATPMSTTPVPSNTVEWIRDCFTADAALTANATFDVTMGKPHRIRTLDGTELDIVDIAISKNSSPWRTWQFAWDLGLVGIVSNSPLAPFGFAAVSVPPPQIEGVVAEFWNTQDFPSSPGGHYFYTSDPAEQLQLETGRYGAWGRTGRSFNAGGYAQVCRFYGSVKPGPNSHFFTGSAPECEGLKAAQRPGAQLPQWNYESLGFSVVLPRIGVENSAACINGTVPVRRAYNNAYTATGKNPWDSNHRLSVSQADIDSVVRQGWKDEGVVFCVPL